MLILALTHSAAGTYAAASHPHTAACMVILVVDAAWPGRLLDTAGVRNTMQAAYTMGATSMTRNTAVGAATQQRPAGRLLEQDCAASGCDRPRPGSRFPAVVFWTCLWLNFAVEMICTSHESSKHCVSSSDSDAFRPLRVPYFSPERHI